MSEPTPPPQMPQPGQSPGHDPVITKPKKRRRRWWLRILIALPILLIALLLLTPTLLSLGLVRSMLMPTVSSAVAPNGKLQVNSWKFAWFGGQRIEGITLLDDQNAAVAHLNVKTDASLWSLLRGKYAAGDTRVDGDFDVRINPETGRVNMMHILGMDDASQPAPPDGPRQDGPAPQPQPEPSRDNRLPIDLGKVSGTLTLNVNGTISSTDPNDRSIPFTKLERGQFTVDLNNLEQGTKIDGNMALNVGGKPASMTLTASADVIENNAIVTDPNAIAANLVASVQQLDLSIVKAALAAAGRGDVDVGGVLAGKLYVDVQRGGAAIVRTEDNFGITDFFAITPELKGDTFRSRRIDLPINITRAAGSDEIKIELFGVRTDLANVSITGTLPQSGLTNLAVQRAPNAAGQLVVATDVPSFANAVRMFPNLAKLQEGVEITNGGLTHKLTLDLKPDGAAVAQALRLEAAGTASGRPIQLRPITLNASADVALRDGLQVQVTDVRSFDVALASSFANINGGGVPSRANITGDANLDTLRAEVSQFADLGTLDLRGNADFTLNTNGDPTDASKPLGFVTRFNVRDVTVAKDQVSYVGNETITGNVDLLLARMPDKQVITVNALAINSSSGLFDIRKEGETTWFALFANGGFGGVGQIRVNAAVDRLIAPFMGDVDPSMRLKRGRLDSVVTFSIDEATKGYKADVDATMSRIAVGDVLNDETLRVVAGATLPEDLTTARATYSVTSNFVTVGGEADVRLSDASKPTLSPFEMARNATFNGTVPSLPKLYALANGLGLIPPATKVDDAGNPLPPMRVEAGSLAFDGRIARDDARNVTAITLNLPGLRDLTLARGETRFRQAEPITLTLAADVTADTSKATVTEQLQRVVISQLAASLPGIATLNMGEPIELLFNVNGKPSAKGQVNGNADLGGVGSLLAVVNGKNSIPYRGGATFEQRIAGDDGRLTLVGNLIATNLAPTDPTAQPLPEKLRKIEVNNDIVTDTAFTTLTINRADLVAPDARDVLRLSLAGTIRELMTQNQMDGVRAIAAYDMAQLWPLIQPIVDPTGESIGRAEVVGKYEKTFTITGSYPMVDAAGTALLFNRSIRSLQISGDLQVDKFAAVDKGVEVQNLALPLTVKDGIARIAYADGRTGGGTFDVNSGKGDLSGLSVDLTGEEAVLGDVRDHKLVAGATINPVVANALGKYINPLFPNATTATGVLDLTLSTSGLKLGPSLMTERSGAATMVMSITQMEIGNPLGEQLVGGAINQLSQFFNRGGINTEEMSNFRGEIRDAKIRLNRGVLTQDMTFMIGRTEAEAHAAREGETAARVNANAREPAQPQLYPFTFSGDVRLSDLNMNLNAGFPIIAVLKRNTNDERMLALLNYIPEGKQQLRIGFTGTTTSPQAAIRAQELIGAFGEAVARQQLERFVGEGANRGNATDANNRNATGGQQTDAERLGQALEGILGGPNRREEQRPDANDRNAEQPTTTREEPPADEPRRRTQAQRRRDAEAAEQRRREEEAQQQQREQQERERRERERRETPRREDPPRDETPRRR